MHFHLFVLSLFWELFRVMGDPLPRTRLEETKEGPSDRDPPLGADSSRCAASG